jgi:hypothetical protein
MQQKITVAANAIQRNLLLEILVRIPLMIGVYIICLYANYHLGTSFWAAMFLVPLMGHLHLFFYLRYQDSENETHLIRLEKPLKKIYDICYRYANETLMLKLEKQLKEIYHFISMYRLMDFVVFSFFSALSIVGTWQTLAKDNFYILSAFIIIAICTAIGSFLIIRWYAGKRYGRHYNTILLAYKALKKDTQTQCVAQ